MLSDVAADQMVADALSGQLLKPPQAQLGEDDAFAGDPRGEHMVEGADPVGGDHEQHILTSPRRAGCRLVELTDLA